MTSNSFRFPMTKPLTIGWSRSSLNKRLCEGSGGLTNLLQCGSHIRDFLASCWLRLDKSIVHDFALCLDHLLVSEVGFHPIRHIGVERTFIYHPTIPSIEFLVLRCCAIFSMHLSRTSFAPSFRRELILRPSSSFTLLRSRKVWSSILVKYVCWCILVFTPVIFTLFIHDSFQTPFILFRGFKSGFI